MPIPSSIFTPGPVIHYQSGDATPEDRRASLMEAIRVQQGLVGQGLVGFDVTVRRPFDSSNPNEDGQRFLAKAPPLLTIGEKCSLTGANEELCAIIHSALCRKSSIWDLAGHNTTLATLLPDDVVMIAKEITHPGVQSSDVAAIMAIRAPIAAPPAPLPEVSESPVGLGCIQGFDHRLGSWK